MSYTYTDDPVMDFHNYDKERSKWLLSRPVCAVCQEPIQDDVMFRIDSKNYCEACLRDEFEVDIPDERWDDDGRDYDPPDDEYDYECDYDDEEEDY